MERTLLIVDDNMKERVLEDIEHEKRLINIKLLTKSEFLDKYFFSYNKDAIYYLKNKYNLTIKNSIKYLDNIKYVINSNLDNTKVNYLKELYKELDNNNLLIKDEYFKDYLNNYDIKVLVTSKIDKFMENIYSNINASYINYKNNIKDKDITLYHFKNIEDEVEYVFNRISSLIKDGVSINNIKIIKLGNEYNHYLERFSYLYNLNINNLNKINIYGTLEVKKVISMIESNSSREDINKYLNNNVNDVKNKIFDILNQYYFVDELRLALDMIKLDFKNASIKDNYIDGIDIIELNSYLINDNDYVFMLGFNLENIPKVYKDIDYLDDKLKSKLNLFTSMELNKIEKDKDLFHIKNINNLIITYKDTDPYKSYYKSNLIDGRVIEDNLVNYTSNLYNKIKLVSKIDSLVKYGSKDKDINILYNTYQDIPYLSYNNKFKGKIKGIDKITLSYTSLNNFYHCKFRYYIDSILKLNIYEDSFKTYIGNLFHYVLSQMFDDGFDFENSFNSYIKDKTFNKKEMFYLEILKGELSKIIEIIKYQHSLTGLTDLKLEQEISLDYSKGNIFKGFVDKIMYKEKDNKTYISVVDYKTGTPKLDMTNAKYGIDMQLPIYAYLIKKGNLFLNPEIIGFYFQQIAKELPTYDSKKTLDDVRKDRLRLQGYSINDQYLVNMFDGTYENSELIRGMKISSKGFYPYTKVLSSEEIDNLVDLVDKKIRDAFEEIREGEFTIDPKIIGGKEIGCSFCKYQDLCFKSGNDFVYLDKNKNFDYLDNEEL